MTSGLVVGLFVAPRARVPMVPCESVVAVERSGLEGDRYALGIGTYSFRPQGGRHITLISAEAIEAVARETGVTLTPAQTRRNVVVTGLPVDDLVGAELAIGDEVVVRGIRPCPPCAHLEKVTGVVGAFRAFEGRGGLRTNIVRGGTIRIGDLVVPN